MTKSLLNRFTLSVLHVSKKVKIKFTSKDPGRLIG